MHGGIDRTESIEPIERLTYRPVQNCTSYIRQNFDQATTTLFCWKFTLKLMSNESKSQKHLWRNLRKERFVKNLALLHSMSNQVLLLALLPKVNSLIMHEELVVITDKNINNK